MGEPYTFYDISFTYKKKKKADLSLSTAHGFMKLYTCTHVFSFVDDKMQIQTCILLSTNDIAKWL